MEKSIGLFKCKNCGNEFHGNYCNNCGQNLITQRFTFKVFFIDAIVNVFSLERGFFYTFQQLFKNPGKVLKEILDGRTKAYFNPIKFLLIIAGFSALIVLITNSFDNTVQLTNDLSNKIVENPEQTIGLQHKIQEFIRNYLNIVSLVMVPFYAFGFRLFFPRINLYYTEHLIINFYAFGVGTFLSLLVTITLAFVPNSTVIDMIAGWLIMVLTYTYFYKKFTEKNLFVTFSQTLVSIIFGFLLFLIIFMLIGIIVVFVLKKTGYF